MKIQLNLNKIISTILKVRYALLILFLYACQPKVHHLDVRDKHLKLVDGLMYYQDELYSGTLSSKIDTLTIIKISYLNGKKHGREQKFFSSGKLAAERFYTLGHKSGTHKAWWDNGQIEFENHFDTQGNPTGVHRSWYSNGQLAKELNFTEGQENGSQKMWDYDGNIKANYQVINGERFGLIGSVNCKPDNYVD